MAIWVLKESVGELGQAQQSGQSQLRYHPRLLLMILGLPRRLCRLRTDASAVVGHKRRMGNPSVDTRVRH